MNAMSSFSLRQSCPGALSCQVVKPLPCINCVGNFTSRSEVDQTVITLLISMTEKYTTENNIFHRKYLVCPEMYLERDNYGKPSYSGPKQVSWLKIESFWQDQGTEIIHSLVILLSLVYSVRLFLILKVSDLMSFNCFPSGNFYHQLIISLS